jgi:hypothetical protein
MDQPSLEGCWAKHKRAWYHAKCLEREVGRFADSGPYNVTHHFDQEQRALILSAETVHPPDTTLWGLILGDLIHNARGSLDHLTWQLALLSGSKPGQHLQFPVETCGRKYWSLTKDGKPSIRDKRLLGIDSMYRTIIDRTQPYRAGQSARLEALNVLVLLSNTDKHRFIHTTAMGIDSDDPDRIDFISNSDVGEIESVETKPFPPKGKAEIARIVYDRLGPNPRMKMEGELPVFIAFGETHVRIEGIGIILNAIESTLKRFAPFFEK